MNRFKLSSSSLLSVLCFGTTREATCWFRVKREDLLMSDCGSWLVENQSRASKTVWGGVKLWLSSLFNFCADPSLVRIYGLFDLCWRREFSLGTSGQDRTKHPSCFQRKKKQKKPRKDFSQWICVEVRKLRQLCCWAGVVGVPQRLCMKAMCETTESHKKQL